MPSAQYKKKFYVTFHKDDRKLAWKYAVVIATIHSDAAIYADHFWGDKVARIRGSGAGYELRQDKRYSELAYGEETQGDTIQ